MRLATCSETLQPTQIRHGEAVGRRRESFIRGFAQRTFAGRVAGRFFPGDPPPERVRGKRMKMIYERFVKQPDGPIPGHREVQTELAELAEVSPQRWARTLRQWDS